MKYLTRASLALNASVLAFLAVIYIATASGHLHGDIELTGWEIGGGSALHAARAQQLAALSTALPTSAVLALTTTIPMKQAAPLPVRKPVRQ